MASTEEISLIIRGTVFKGNKDVLCMHSDYFRAMFSGNYIEKTMKSIIIDNIDPTSMDTILNYMNTGQLVLPEIDFITVGNLAQSAKYLQVTELIKQIEYTLDHQLSISNWVEIMNIAEEASYPNLERLAASFGLLSFKEMKPEYIPDVQKLFWYLSHSSLNTESEFDVFKFGYKWVFHSDFPHPDLLLVVLGCLDFRNLNIQDLKEISMIMSDYKNTFASQIVECLKMILDNKLKIEMQVLIKHMERLHETFGEKVYGEVYTLVKYSNERLLQYTPVVPMWEFKDGKLDHTPHYMYIYSSGKGFKKWLEVADKNMWGWNLVMWGANKIVQVCGEIGRGSGQFMKDVKVYNTLNEEWTLHGVQLPPRRHAGVTISGDSLFIVGGVGEFRVIEDKAIIYDLKNKTFRQINNFPDAIQSPGICTHYGSVFVSGHKNIYKYEDMEEVDTWTKVLTTEIQVNRMASFQGYIYCTQNYFSHLYRFRPGIDIKLELVTLFSAATVGLCSVGTHLVSFTRAACDEGEEFKVEEYTAPCKCPEGICNMSCCPQITWSKKNSDITLNDVAGTCAIVLELTSIYPEPSKYHQKYISKYGHITYNDDM